jgi:hypothetical protein
VATDSLLGLPVRSRTGNDEIDESSAEELRDAASYVQHNAMLIQVPVVGTARTFWRLSDEATRMIRKLALILRNHHSVCKCLAAPLQASNVWVGSAGNAKLRGARFTDKGFSVERVREDYRNLFWVLQQLISISGGDTSKLPPDYIDFLSLLTEDNLTNKDEFLVVNHAALLPLKNRYFFLTQFHCLASSCCCCCCCCRLIWVSCGHSTEAFLMLYDRIVKYLGKRNRAKMNRILSCLPYQNDWLDTATANAKINQWIVNVQNTKEYRKTTFDLLRLNRNVRSHLHEYGHDDDVEEILYCEWPMLLVVMEKMLHREGELQDTDIENKFG